MSTAVIEPLLADAEAGVPLELSAAYQHAHLEGKTAEDAAGWIRARPDASAFLLLLALRRDARDVYDKVPAQLRARVLASSLRDQNGLVDWGYLDPGGSYDGPAAQALLELGDAAVPELAPLLADDRTARVPGSEVATIAKKYGYRKADFAYRYVRRLRGDDAPFDPDPARRDQEIRELQRELGS
jgi:hypothetical protein